MMEIYTLSVLVQNIFSICSNVILLINQTTVTTNTNLCIQYKLPLKTPTEKKNDTNSDKTLSVGNLSFYGYSRNMASFHVRGPMVYADTVENTQDNKNKT